MKCVLAGLCALWLLSGSVVWGQSSTNGTSSSTVADNPPADNVRGGAVRQRAPGLIVQSAIARHQSLARARRTAQLTGDTSGLVGDQSTSSSGSSSNSGSNSGLSGLLGGSISSLLNTFLGSGSGTTNTGTSGSSLTNLPPEVIQMLTNAGINLSDLTGSTQKSRDVSASSDESSLRAQSSGTSGTGTTQDRKFIARWADAMLSTVFTSLSVAFQTQNFITLLKDFFRPILGVPTTTQPSASAATTNPTLVRAWTPAAPPGAFHPHV